MGERCNCIILTDANASFAVGEGVKQATLATGQPLRIVAIKGPSHDTFARLLSVTAPPLSVDHVPLLIPGAGAWPARTTNRSRCR